MNKKFMIEKAMKENKSIRVHVESCNIMDNGKGIELTEKGIHAIEQDFLVPWELVSGFTAFGDKCDSCSKSFDEVERHYKDENYNLCKDCGNESDKLMGI